MKIFPRSLKTILVIIALLTLVFGIIYPMFMFGIGQLFFHKKANGNLVYNQKGQILGAELIGQNFTKPEYFHPRPSSAGNGYDAAASSGSNLGPTSQKLADILKKRVSDYRSENKLNSDILIPVDAVTASASGLKPHISPSNALLQAPRVAATRNISEEKVKHLIVEYTEGATLGLFGEERVKVLKLNLALDRLSE